MDLRNKTNRPFAYKSIGNTVHDIDTASKTVVFYSNAFDKIDDQDDIIRKGAFSRSIREWGPQSQSTRKIKHCLFHDESRLPGVITEISEDGYGLKTAVKMSDNTLGRDTLESYKDGVYTEHSIRMGYIEGRLKWVEDKALPNGGFFDVSEGKLWHTSTVAFGSNENTHVVGFKSIDTPEAVEKALVDLNARMNVVTKAIREGKYSDEGFKHLAYNLTELQDEFNALFEVSQVNKAAIAEKPQHTNTANADLSFLKTISFI